LERKQKTKPLLKDKIMKNIKTTTKENNLGTKIRMLRELRNLSQKYMADELNLSLSGYGKLERGETDPSYSRLTKIAHLLQLSIEDLIHFKPYTDEHAFLTETETKGQQNPSQSMGVAALWDVPNNEVNRLQAENHILRGMINQIVSQI